MVKLHYQLKSYPVVLPVVAMCGQGGRTAPSGAPTDHESVVWPVALPHGPVCGAR